MTVEELMVALNKLPKDMSVVDTNSTEIDYVIIEDNSNYCDAEGVVKQGNVVVIG